MKAVCKKLFSLVLVAILLVSAVPFQARADGACNVMIHITGSETKDLFTQVEAGGTLDVKNFVTENFTGSNPTGYTIESVTDKDGNALAGGVATITEATHIYVTIANKSTSMTLTLNAVQNGGTVDGGDTKTYTVSYNGTVPELPNAVKANSTFLGWYSNADGTGMKLASGQTWTLKDATTFYACFSQNMSNLQIKALYYVGGTQTKTVLLHTLSLPENTNVLNYVKDNASTLITVPTGYSWDTYWYDYTGNVELTQQNLNAMVERSVCVKFTANTYKLYFDANGGTVTPTSKSVTYDAAVGELPTPTKKNALFSHWEDESGNKYTASTVYKVAGDTKLIARWDNEAYVLLHIHTDKTSTPLIVQLKGYVVGDEISRTTVQNVVKKYYTGSSMSLVGLYTDAAWDDYVAGGEPTAENSFTVTDANPSIVHVLVKNGTLGGNSSTDSTTKPTTSTNPTTKPSDTTNPQTGDNSMVYTAMTVMLIAAAAVAVLYLGRKKKLF